MSSVTIIIVVFWGQTCVALTIPQGESRTGLSDGDIPGTRTVETKPYLTDSMSHYTVIHIQGVRLGACVDVKQSPDSKLSEESRRIHLSGKRTRGELDGVRGIEGAAGPGTWL